MNIKCVSCSASLFSLFGYMFKKVPAEGLVCENCQTINIRNPYLFPVSFVASFATSSILKAIHWPEYVSLLVALFVAVLSISIFALTKPFTVVSTKELKKKSKALNWYTSPIIYLLIFSALTLFLFLK